ncbi:olfactory receptor 2K2-like [Ambystoma mexicanum]|uniref:olfactory receptor 2K2-like n=1 Tax=Ambystoma mexicanum TaxID=8296 RepID=UPI0037E77411
MERLNDTIIIEFILLGLSNNPKIRIILFVVFLLIYIIILVGNALILAAIIVDAQLHTPMYFFLLNLSFLDMCYSSITIPKFLQNSLSVMQTISFAGCAAQMYLGLALGITECILLAIMAYDRYAAICYPLRYVMIMKRDICIRLATWTWTWGFVFSVVHVSFTLQVPLCGHNQIDHFECEMPALLRLACTDVSLIEMIIFVSGIFFIMMPIALILLSYIRIIICILKIRAASGRYKAFSTCGSHILVVFLFYGTAMYIYLKPPAKSRQSTDKMVAVVYAVLAPVLNPVIYTLRNKEVKRALKKTIVILFSKKP